MAVQQHHMVESLLCHGSNVEVKRKFLELFYFVLVMDEYRSYLDCSIIVYTIHYTLVSNWTTVLSTGCVHATVTICLYNSCFSILKQI